MALVALGDVLGLAVLSEPEVIVAGGFSDTADVFPAVAGSSVLGGVYGVASSFGDSGFGGNLSTVSLPPAAKRTKTIGDSISQSISNRPKLVLARGEWRNVASVARRRKPKRRSKFLFPL